MYKVVIRRSTQKSLRNLPPSVQEGIAEALIALRNDARPLGCKKLAAGLGWSLRVGGYRIIYDIDDDTQTVDIRFIGPRGEAYRRF